MLRPTSLAVLMIKESKHYASSMLSERRAMSFAKSVSVIYVAGNLRLNLCVIVRPRFSRYLVEVHITQLMTMTSKYGASVISIFSYYLSNCAGICCCYNFAHLLWDTVGCLYVE